MLKIHYAHQYLTHLFRAQLQFLGLTTKPALPAFTVAGETIYIQRTTNQRLYR